MKETGFRIDVGGGKMMLIIIMGVLIISLSYWLGWKQGYKNARPGCHIEDSEVDELVSKIGRDGGYFGRLSLNTTVGGVVGGYNAYKPYSKYLLEVELDKLCDE